MRAAVITRGESRVYPKDVDMNLIMTDMVNIIRAITAWRLALTMQMEQPAITPTSPCW